MNDQKLQALIELDRRGRLNPTQSAAVKELANRQNPAQEGGFFNEPSIPTPRTYSDVSPPPMEWGDVASQAVQNIPASAKQFGKDMVQPILHPIDTAKAVGNVALGTAQKLIPGEQEAEASADAVGQFFADRYGSIENLKNTIAKDPVGFAADLSTVLTGGGAAVARAPGMAGKAAHIASKAGAMVDPLTLAAKGVTKGMGAAGKGAAALLGDLGTHTGADTVKAAFNAGKEGGEASRAFTGSMRGNVPMTKVLDDARGALEKMRRERSQAYKSGMAGVTNDKTVLDFGEVKQALGQAITDNTFNGIPKSKATARALDEVSALVDEWGNLDPAVYHTAEGFDALKQRLSDLVDWKNRGDAENRAAQSMQAAVRGVIEKQAPGYAKVMKDYSEATDVLKEIEKTLSLNPNASVDTAMRKLQSLTRNNVNTNYSNRAELMTELERRGGNMTEQLAGQAMNSWTPRGLGRVQAGGTGVAGIAGGMEPITLATLLAAQSPRVVGEMSHAAGTAARPASRLAGKLNPDLIRNLALENWQIGRVSGDEQDRLNHLAKRLLQ